jgi:hypothetical protein
MEWPTLTFTEIDVVSLLWVLIGSFIGPWLAVLAAQSLARQESKQQALMDVLRNINRHVINYYNVFLARHPETFGVIRISHQIVQQNPIPRESTIALAEATVDLNGDVFSLGLLVGNEESKPVGSRIQALIGLSDFLVDEKKAKRLPNYEQCKKTLDGDIKELMTVHVKALWEKFGAGPTTKPRRGIGARFVGCVRRKIGV